MFKKILIWSFGGPPVWWSKTIYAILKEGIIGNICVKLFEIWTSGSGGDVVQRKSLRKTDGRTTHKNKTLAKISEFTVTSTKQRIKCLAQGHNTDPQSVSN